MRKRAWIFIAVLGCIGCQSPAPPPANKAIPVEVAGPQVRDVTTYLEALGTLQPSETYEIRPRIQGTVEEILVQEGVWIKEGDPLFKIDIKPYAIQVQQAEAQLAMDKAASTAAQQKLERLRGVAEKGLIPKIEWEAIQAGAASADALLQLDRAKLAAAQLDLENCTLLAPGAGRIGKIDISKGAFVVASQAAPLAAISQLDPLIVEFSITEKEFSTLDKHASNIMLQSLCSPDAQFDGKIFFLDHAFEPTTGKLLVRAEVGNKELCLVSGQSVRVKIATHFMPNQMLIPQKAIKYNSQGPYAYIVDENGCAALRNVSLGSEIDEDVIVTEGIAPEDKVITVGHLRLFPGIKVEVKP